MNRQSSATAERKAKNYITGANPYYGPYPTHDTGVLSLTDPQCRELFLNTQ